MLYANIDNNGEISLVNESEGNQLATYDELLEELSLSGMEIGYLTMVKDGVVVWNNKKVEMEFVEFMN